MTTMTKKEIITLLREDARYQRSTLKSNKPTMIKINNMALNNFRNVKLHLAEDFLTIYCEADGIAIPVCNLFYDRINSIGYKYSSAEKLSKRLYELRAEDFDAHCSKEA